MKSCSGVNFGKKRHRIVWRAVKNDHHWVFRVAMAVGRDRRRRAFPKSGPYRPGAQPYRSMMRIRVRMSGVGQLSG